MTLVFWLCAGVLGVHFVIFPLVLFVLSRGRRSPPAASVSPSVTLVIAAYNEEKVITAKLENSLALTYPADKLEILVVCDGSTDATAAIAKGWEGKAVRAVRSLHEPARKGKSAALNRAVSRARGDVLVFSDANCLYRPDAVEKLVRHFADPAVGGVSGRKSIRPEAERESARGDSTFWSVESRVKTWQSLVGSVSVADGEIFAVRREAWVPIPEDTINDDAFETLALVRAGRRVLYEPEAVSEEPASRTLEEDFRVKARMVCGGMQTLARNAGWLLVPRSFFAWQFLIHKAVRYFLPFFLAGLFVSSLFAGYWAVFGAQAVFYGAAALGAALRRGGKVPAVLYFPVYFVAMNLAALTGVFYFFRRAPLTAVWKKAER